ncbi:bifunctional DNA primase/polymerase [Streptomyces sp. 796.1]|uniref:bifunctional DNA primase/polymerase n=1 Tax=Streptomyces sp. 796.1 TaxID=3163029 RepID=UPI0039C9BEDA
MAPTPRPSLLVAALDAAARGWPVFPLRPRDKRPTGHAEPRCLRVGPCADGHHTWEQRATTDRSAICAAWSLRPYNIGIATGPANLVVIDLDQPKLKGNADTPNGATNLLALCERAGQPVPRTYRVRTASGGWHLYFTAPPGTRLNNTAGRLGPLIDTRAWGGYVVAVGSTAPHGIYELADSVPVAPLPDWLGQLLRPAPAQPARPLKLRVVNGSSAARAALERECAVVSGAPDKQRNTTLNRCAFKVGRFVAWGDIPRHEVEEAFQGAGEARGLTAAECRATIRSALDSSLRKARPRDAA